MLIPLRVLGITREVAFGIPSMEVAGIEVLISPKLKPIRVGNKNKKFKD